MTKFAASSKAAEAPDIEAQLYDMEFLRVEAKTIKGGKFQKNPEGDPKLEWFFAPLDDDGDQLYDKGEPVEVSKLTGVGFNIASKTTPAEVLILKALLSKEEYALFEGGQGTPDSEAPAPEGLKGRRVQGEVFIKEDGWPGIGAIIAARKPRTSK